MEWKILKIEKTYRKAFLWKPFFSLEKVGYLKMQLFFGELYTEIIRAKMLVLWFSEYFGPEKSSSKMQLLESKEKRAEEGQ